VELIEVKSNKDRKEFIGMAVRLYRKEVCWIRPLDIDIENVFDSKKNKLLKRNGESIRWLLKNEDGQTIGRVAAFINPKTVNKENDQPTGGMGFFECINNQEAANLMFDACKKWLEDRGMEAMDGPINFGDRDAWWGLLVKGFDKEPNYRCNYNLDYYKELFENYGFQLYFNQYTYGRKTRAKLSDKLARKADKIAKDPGYTFSHMKLNNINKFIEDFRIVYNKAWANHAGVAKMPAAQARQMIYQMKPIIDEKIIWFGYYNGEPIAFFIMLPEVNQIFKYVNGKMNWIGKLKFIYHKWRKTCNKILGLVFGVVPEHQRKGVEGALIMAGRQMVQDDYRRYENYEMNWIGDFNPKMIRVVEQVGGARSKIHITYRKLFDESKPFKRSEIKI